MSNPTETLSEKYRLYDIFKDLNLILIYTYWTELCVADKNFWEQRQGDCLKFKSKVCAINVLQTSLNYSLRLCLKLINKQTKTAKKFMYARK